MIKRSILLFFAMLSLTLVAGAKTVRATKEHRELIKQHIYGDYKQMYRQPTGIALIYPYITPGSRQYANVLWDWDSWLSNVALRQTLNDVGTDSDRQEALVYEQGCVLNYLAYTSLEDGYMPMVVDAESDPNKIKPKDIYKTNMHNLVWLSMRHSWCNRQKVEPSGFMTMWAGIGTPEQARRMVKENLLDERTFCGTYGVRTLSKLEKMYNLKATNNPSNWQGPLWGISNYMVWRGLADYGLNKEARMMAEKTIALFGEDLKKNGVLHEYYDPDSGLPIMNPGFQNWNYLVLNMVAWLEGRYTVREF